MRLHVATIARNFAEAGSPGIAASIDQEAAAVLVAHIAVVKADLNDSPDVLRWLVCMLTRLCQTTGRKARQVSGLPTTSASTLNSCSTCATVNSFRSSTKVLIRQLLQTYP
jgi:hypothetical protein